MAVDATTIVLGLLATPTLIWLITYFGKWSIIGSKFVVVSCPAYLCMPCCVESDSTQGPCYS